MTNYAEDALRQFQQLVRDITGANLTQTDAAVELNAIRERYSKDGEARSRVAEWDALVELSNGSNPDLSGLVRDAMGAGRLGL